MIVFSTMVTVILEIIYRILQKREQIFKEMLGRLFNQVLWPLVQERLSSMSVDGVRAHFVDAMTRNSAASDPGAPARRGALRRIDNSKMTVLEFAERLAGTEVGKAIATEGQERVVAIVNDLAQKYDRFCSGARTFLVERSLTFSIVISIVLAFALNVDAIVLFRSFVQDEKLRGAMIERYAAIEKDMNAAKAALEKQAKAQPQPGGGDAGKGVAEIEARLEDVKRQVVTLTEVGLPIGYDNFPGCLKPTRNSVDLGDCSELKGSKDFLANVEHNVRTHKGDFAFWVMSVLLGGLLIGLGAPFWFDVAQGLSKSLQLLKAFGGGREQEKKEEAAAAAVASGASPPPRTPVEAFTTAIAALPRTN
jgi:hypothetical protein